MVCNNCSKEIKDDSSFCPYCGKEIEKFINDKDLKKRNQASDRVALSIIFLSIGLFIFLVVYGSNYINLMGSSKFISFGSDEIKTVSSVIENSKLVNIVDLKNYKEYKYSLDNLDIDDVNKYIDSLYDQGFIGYKENDIIVGYIKSSSDKDYVIKANIDTSTGYFLVTYSKEFGSLGDYSY